MKVYEVAKYDPKLYDPNGYIPNDWLDYSDLGSPKNNPVLSFEDYFKVETAYAEAIIRFAETLGGPVQLDRIDDRRHEIENDTDRKGIVDSHRSFNTLIIDDTATLKDVIRLNLRGFIGADLIFPGRGFVDFDFDFYMYFGMKSDQEIDWAHICQGILFERDRSAELIDTDNFDKCTALAGLTKSS